MMIKDVMTANVGMAAPATTVAEAARMMKEADIGILPVADGDRLVGMISDRDIVVRAVANGKEAGEMPVSEAMSDRLLYCFEDQSLSDVASNMGENQIRRLPVLNRDKRLVGIVSLGDLSTSGATGEVAKAMEEISAPAH